MNKLRVVKQEPGGEDLLDFFTMLAREDYPVDDGQKCSEIQLGAIQREADRAGLSREDLEAVVLKVMGKPLAQLSGIEAMGALDWLMESTSIQRMRASGKDTSTTPFAHWLRAHNKEVAG